MCYTECVFSYGPVRGVCYTICVTQCVRFYACVWRDVGSVRGACYAIRVTQCVSVIIYYH